MIPFTSPAFVPPPRPETAMPPRMIPVYQKQGWLCQIKKNGAYSLIYVSPDKEVTSLNRHGEPHKAWSWSAATRRAFERLPGNGWFVLCAELLHSKTPGIKDTHYVHDIMVFDGNFLLGNTYAQRYKLLQDLFLKSGLEATQSHWVVDDHTWLVRNVRGDYTAIYEGLHREEDEGIVLKQPGGILTTKNTTGNQIKIRRPTKNFSF